MSGSHTPGPWRIADCSQHPTDDDNGVRMLDIRAGEIVLSPYEPMLTGHIDCGGVGIASIIKGRHNSWADANLIAAAPDMLEACCDAAMTFEQYAEMHAAKATSEGDLKAERNRAMARKCRAAIGKARGAA